MGKPYLSLQPSEGIVVSAAATIYAAWIQAGEVNDDNKKLKLEESIMDAITIARKTDNSVQSDNEMD